MQYMYRTYVYTYVRTYEHTNIHTYEGTNKHTYVCTFEAHVLTFSSTDYKLYLEGVELPPDEAVVVRVDGGRHKRAPPVHCGAELVHVVAAPGREVLEPLQGVCEAGDLLL